MLIKEEYNVTIPKGAKIILDKQEAKWTCPHHRTVYGLAELTSGSYWLTRFCTVNVQCSINRIQREYPDMWPLIKQPFSFLAKDIC